MKAKEQFTGVNSIVFFRVTKIVMEQLKIYPNPTTGVLHITGNRHCGLDTQFSENHEIAGQACLS